MDEIKVAGVLESNHVKRDDCECCGQVRLWYLEQLREWRGRRVEVRVRLLPEEE